MDRLKYIKLENEDGSYSSSIPLAVDSNHVDVNGNTLTNELNNKANNSSIVNLQNQISSLASGSPLVASSTSDMTDTNRIYVNTTDGHWYWYNGSSWIDGGIYQATITGSKRDNSSSLFNNDEIGANGVKLYGRQLSVQSLVIHPNSRVNYSKGHYSFYTQIEKNKYYYIKKSATNSRFRVGLLKEEPPLTEALSEPVPIAKIVYDDNDGTVCGFYSEDYEYLIVYVGTTKPTNTCMLYEETVANSYPLFLISETNDKLKNEFINDLLMNYNNSDLWEIGGIDGYTGENNNDSQFIRTKTYIDPETLYIVRDKIDNNIQTGIRLYEENGTYLSSILKYQSTYNNPANTNKYKVRIVVKKIVKFLIMI